MPTSPTSASSSSSSSQLPAVPWHIFSSDLQTLRDEANRRRTTSLADSCSAATMAIQINTSATQNGDIHKALKAETDASEALWQVFTVATDTLRGSKFSAVGIAGLGKLAAANLMLPSQIQVTCSMLKKMFWNSALFSNSSSSSSSNQDSSSSSNENSYQQQNNAQPDEDIHMRVAQTLCSMLCSDAAREVGLEYPLSVALALYSSTPFPHVQAAAGAAILQVTSPLLDYLIPPNYYFSHQQQKQNDDANKNREENQNQKQQEPHLVDGPLQKQHMAAVYLFRDCIILSGWSSPSSSSATSNTPQSPMWLQGLNLNVNNSSPAAHRAKQTIATLCLDILLSFFSSRDAAVAAAATSSSSSSSSRPSNSNNNSNNNQDSSSSSSNSKIGSVTKQRLPHLATVINNFFVPVFCSSVFSTAQEIFSRFHRLVVAVVGQLWPLFEMKPFHTLLEKNVQLILGGGGPVSMISSSSSSNNNEQKDSGDNSATTTMHVSVPSTEVSWRIMSIVSQWRRVVSLVGLLPCLVEKEFYEFQVTTTTTTSKKSNPSSSSSSSAASNYDWQTNPLIRLLLAPARVLEAMVSSSNSNNNNQNSSRVIWAPELVGVLVDFTTSLCQALARWFGSSSNLAKLANGSQQNQQQQNTITNTTKNIIQPHTHQQNNQQKNQQQQQKEIPVQTTHDIFDVVFSQLYCCFALAISRLSGEDVLHCALKAVNHLVSCACAVRHAPARDAFLLLLSNELREDLKLNSSSTSTKDESSSSSVSRKRSSSVASQQQGSSNNNNNNAVTNVLTERKIHILNTVVSIANGLGNDLGHAWRIIIRCFLLAWDLKCASEKLIRSGNNNNNNNNNNSQQQQQNSASTPNLDELAQAYNLPSDSVLDEHELNSVSFAMEHVFESTSSCFSDDCVRTLAHFLAQIPSDAEDEKGNRILPRDPLLSDYSHHHHHDFSEDNSQNNNVNTDSPIVSDERIRPPQHQQQHSSSQNLGSASLINNNTLPSEITPEGIEFISTMMFSLLKSSLSSPILHNNNNKTTQSSKNNNARRNSPLTTNHGGKSSEQNENDNYIDKDDETTTSYYQHEQFISENESRFVDCYWPAAKSFLIAVCKSSTIPHSITRKCAVKFCSDVINLINQQMGVAFDNKLDFFLFPQSLLFTNSSENSSSSHQQQKNTNNNKQSRREKFIFAQIQLSSSSLGMESSSTSFSSSSPEQSNSSSNSNSTTATITHHQTYIQQKFSSSLMSLPIQALLELFQRSDSIFSTNTDCPPPEARRLIVNEALQIVQQHGAMIIGDGWQYLCKIAELSALTTHVGNDGDVLTTAFRIVELIHHGCIVQLGQLGLIKFIASIGAFIRQTVSDQNLSVNLSAVHIAWSVADYIVSGENQQNNNTNSTISSPSSHHQETEEDLLSNKFQSPKTSNHVDPSNNNNHEENNETDPRFYASTPKRQVSWSSLQWDALLIQLRDGGCDARPEIRQSALRSLFAVVSTHGSNMPSEVWSTCVWEVLLHVVERFESDIVAPLRNHGILSEENSRSKSKNANNQNQNQQQQTSSKNSSSSSSQQPSYEVLSSRRPQWLEVYVSLLEGLPRVVMKFVDFISRHASNSHKVFGRLVSFGANALLATASEHVSLAAARLLAWLLSELAPCPTLLDNNDFDALLLSLNEVGQRCQSESGFILNVLKTLIESFSTTLRNLCSFSSHHHQMQVPARLYGPLSVRSARAQHSIDRFINFVEMSLDSESVHSTFMFPASVQTSALDFADALVRMLSMRKNMNTANTNNNDNSFVTLSELLCASSSSSQQQQQHGRRPSSSSSTSSPTTTTTNGKSSSFAVVVNSEIIASVWFSIFQVFLSRVPSSEKVIEVIEACKSIMSKQIKETSFSSSSSSTINLSELFKNVSSFTTSQALAKFIDRGCQPAFVANALKWMSNTWPLISNNPDHPKVSAQLLPELLHITSNAIPLSCLPPELFGNWNGVGVAATSLYLVASSTSFPRMTKKSSSSTHSKNNVTTGDDDNNSSSSSESKYKTAELSVLDEILMAVGGTNNDDKNQNTSNNNKDQNRNSPNQQHQNQQQILSPGRGSASSSPHSYLVLQEQNQNQNQQNTIDFFYSYNLESPSSFTPSRHTQTVKLCTSTLVDLVINKMFETLKDLDALLPTTLKTKLQQQQQSSSSSIATNNNDESQHSTSSPFSNNKTTWQLLSYCGKVFRALCFITQNDLVVGEQQQKQENIIVETAVSNLLEVFVSMANQENEETNARSETMGAKQSKSPASFFQLELVEAASSNLISAWGLLDALNNNNLSSSSSSSKNLDPRVVEEKVVKRTMNLIETYIEKCCSTLQSKKSTTGGNNNNNNNNNTSSSPVLIKRIVSSLGAFNQGNGVPPSKYSEARKRLLKNIANAALPLISCARDDEVRVAVQNLFGLVLEL